MKKSYLWCMVLGTALGFLENHGTVASQQTVDLSVTEFVMEHDETENHVLPMYMTVEGEAVAGRTVDEIREWIEEEVELRKNRHVTLNVLGNLFEYEMSAFGINWDNPEVLDSLDSYTLTGNFVERYTKQKDMQNNPVALELEFSIDEAVLAETVELYAVSNTTEPRNAAIEIINNNEIQLLDGEVGRVFDAPSIEAELKEKMLNFDTTDTLVYEFPHTDTDPEYWIEDMKYTFSVLGEFATQGLGEEPRRNNIIRSAEGINGTMVYPGETVSALNLYGEVTLENGYNEAPTYQDGQQLPGVGGGICQTTTTLYDALLYAEMGIQYRSPHSMLVSYTPPSMDAMVDYGTKSDFVFYNNREKPIYLQAFVENDRLVVRVWGEETRDPARSIRYEHSLIGVIFPDPLYEVEAVDDTLCAVGPHHVADKLYEEVSPHPHVVSQLWKIVSVNGVDVERTQVTYGTKSNADGVRYDEYKPMKGWIYRASDCLVTNTLINDPDAWLGQRVHHEVKFLNGNRWEPIYYDYNVYGIGENPYVEPTQPETAPVPTDPVSGDYVPTEQIPGDPAPTDPVVQW